MINTVIGCNDTRCGENGNSLWAMLVSAVVLLFFASYLSYHAWQDAEWDVGDFTLFAILISVGVLLAVAALLLFQNGRRTLQRLRTTADGSWELRPFVGKTMVRQPEALEVYCIDAFSRRQRFFRVLNLLSRHAENYIIHDREDGATYFANGETLGRCLRELAETSNTERCAGNGEDSSFS